MMWQRSLGSSVGQPVCYVMLCFALPRDAETGTYRTRNVVYRDALTL
jgi:hypothetical protein